MIAVEIPESYLLSPPVYSAVDLKVDLAALLYRREKMSLAKAARWCGMSRLEFQAAMAERGIEIHFSEDDLLHDVQTLDKFFSK